MCQVLPVVLVTLNIKEQASLFPTTRRVDPTCTARVPFPVHTVSQIPDYIKGTPMEGKKRERTGNLVEIPGENVILVV